MLAVQSATEPVPLSLSPSRTTTLWLTAAVLCIAFYFIEHGNTAISTLEEFRGTADELVARTTEGDMGRRLAIPLMAVFGALLLLRRDGWKIQIQSPLGWLLLGYLAWCGLSILWSEDPSVTIRHYGALLLCSIAALGIARRVTLRELCLIALVVATILIANGVRTEIALGTFRPFSLDYRFAGTMHPNAQAAYCAIMALAAIFLARDAKAARTLLWALALTGIVLLLLTRSRTVCGAFLLGLLAYGAVGASRPKIILVGIGILWAGCAVALAGLLFDSDFERHATNYALLGRQEETDSLSGRIPLWTELLPHVEEGLLLGHGYETFWNPQRIASFSEAFEWPVPDGHATWLDALLDLGVIGAALGAVTVIVGIRAAARRCGVMGDAGCGFLLALLVCRSLNGVLESGLFLPTSFPPFILICGLAHLGLCAEPLAKAPAEQSTQDLRQ